jgi:hypothetical protein
MLTAPFLHGLNFFQAEEESAMAGRTVTTAGATGMAGFGGFSAPRPNFKQMVPAFNV